MPRCDWCEKIYKTDSPTCSPSCKEKIASFGPEKGDWVTNDKIFFVRKGYESRFSIEDTTKWEDEIIKMMNTTKSWSNVWFSNNGNMELLILERYDRTYE